MRLPRYPIYVPSKRRSQYCHTVKALLHDHVPFFLVIEPQEHDIYRQRFPMAMLLTLPKNDGGLIYARNWIKAHATAAGLERHWQLDDNIRGFYRWYRGKRLNCQAGIALAITEDFVDRYENVAIAGLNYDFFAPGHRKMPPFYLNVHVYSCVAPHTPILCADLVWRAAESLQPGQRIVAFDAEPAFSGRGQNARAYHTATIQRNEPSAKESFLVSTDVGIPVRASQELSMVGAATCRAHDF